MSADSVASPQLLELSGIGQADRLKALGVSVVHDLRGVGDEIAPGEKAKSDGELIAWVTENAETTYHLIGTCKMGADPMAVVDDRLRVHGMEGIGVADASIMPTLTSDNTNAPSIMIGEKAAEMTLAEV